MNEQSVAKLIPSRPDADVAKDLKAEILAKVAELCPLLDKATAAGFHAAFTLGPGWDGKQHVTQFTFAKHF